MQKNVLILAHSYGMQFLESCNQYSQLFDPKKYKVHVIYLAGKPCLEIQKKTLAEDVSFLDLSSRELRGLKIKTIAKFIKLCREKRFEIVICHRYKPAYIMMWAAQFCRINVLLFVMHAPETMHAFSRKLLLYGLMRKNMFLVGVSNAIQQDMQNDLPLLARKKILTFYNIIDPVLFESQFFSRKEAREKLNIPDDIFLFGTIARLVIDKDQKTLIKAFAIVKAKHAHTKLILIGDGKLELSLKKLVKELQLENDIIFTGFIPDGFRFMKAFDVFVLPSISEAFGRVLLEAMIARIPVIATQIEGIPEVMGDTGILIDAGNPERLSEEMIKQLNTPNDENAERIVKAYQRMQHHFTFAPFKENFWQSPIAKFL